MGNTLDAEVLNNIKPFSGAPEEMLPGERIISEGKALQRVQTQYTTAVAVQQPRSIAKVTRNVLEESKLAGAAFYYRWEVTNRKTNRKSVVQGPSIDLAMCIARNYGNCAVDIEGTETPTHYMFKGVFIDLETGFTVPRLFRQRKNQAIGKFEDDRAEDIVFQIGQSKAQRNAITKAAPGWLIDQAIEQARASEIAKIKPENLHLARSKVLDFFSEYGVAPERIENKIGRKADQWTAEDLADLRGSATALREGRISPDELFPETEPKAEAPSQPEAPAPIRVDAEGNEVPLTTPIAETKKRGRQAKSTEPSAPEKPRIPDLVNFETGEVAGETADPFVTEAEQYQLELSADAWDGITRLHGVKGKPLQDFPKDEPSRKMFLDRCKKQLALQNEKK